MRCLCLTVATLMAIIVPSAALEAHTILKKPFQERYDFKSVSCFACHAKGKDKDGKRLGKEALNTLGKLIKKETGDGQLNKRVEEAKKTDRTTRKKLYEQITKDFILALQKLEEQKSPDGMDTWGDLLKAGKVDGVKLKPKKDESAES